MPGASKEIDLTQLAAFLGREAEALARLDFTVPLKVCALLIKADVKENFVGSHAPDGMPWPPLKRPGKKRGGKAAKPLRNTGLLMASITASGQGHVEEVTADSLTVGSALDYAGWQNDGTRTIPAREFAGFSDRVLDQIEDVLGDFIEKNVF